MKSNVTAANKFNSALKKIEATIYEIVSQEIKFELDDIPLSVRIIVDGLKLGFDLLPDGLKSIISWIADLLMRLDRINWIEGVDILDRNIILLLDEIDVHLHPAWQRKNLPVLKRLFKNAQIFVSTHSPFVVDSIDGAWVYRFKKEGHYSVAPFLKRGTKS